MPGMIGLFSTIAPAQWHTQNWLLAQANQPLVSPEANSALASAIEANEPSATAAHSAAPTAASSWYGPSCIGILNSASSESRSTELSRMPLPEPISTDRSPAPSFSASRYESASWSAIASNSALAMCPGVNVPGVSSRKATLARGLLRDPVGGRRAPPRPLVGPRPPVQSAWCREHPGLAGNRRSPCWHC
jgi:hypothetical protein